MRAFHCTLTLALLLALPAASAFAQSASADRAQAPAVPAAPAAVGYTVFLRGAPVGHQEVTVRSDAQGLVISGQGQLAQPLDVITRRAELKYRPDQTPEAASLRFPEENVGRSRVDRREDQRAKCSVTEQLIEERHRYAPRVPENAQD